MAFCQIYRKQKTLIQYVRVRCGCNTWQQDFQKIRISDETSQKLLVSRQLIQYDCRVFDKKIVVNLTKKNKLYLQQLGNENHLESSYFDKSPNGSVEAILVFQKFF